MATTRYIVQIDAVSSDKSYTKKDRAVTAAREALAAKEGYVVTVRTEAGTEVFRAARRRITKVTPAGTKVVDLPAEFKALVPAGYAAAYMRLRNGAAVLRRETDETEDDSRYAVLDLIAKSIAGYAPTTRDAGQIMKRLPGVRA